MGLIALRPEAVQGRVMATMENSKNWIEFKAKLDARYPKFEVNTQLALDVSVDDDDGHGL